MEIEESEPGPIVDKIFSVRIRFGKDEFGVSPQRLTPDRLSRFD
jgi:hypothetical protein